MRHMSYDHSEAIPLLLKNMIINHIKTAWKNKKSRKSVKSRTWIFILSHFVAHPFFGHSTGFLQWHDDARITTKVICLFWEGSWDNILHKRLKNLWIRECVMCVRCVIVVFVCIRSSWYGKSVIWNVDEVGCGRRFASDFDTRLISGTDGGVSYLLQIHF